MTRQQQYNRQRRVTEQRRREKRKKQLIRRVISCMVFLVCFAGGIKMIQHAQGEQDKQEKDSLTKQKMVAETESTLEQSRIEESGIAMQEPNAVEAGGDSTTVSEEYEECVDELVAFVKENPKASVILDNMEDYPVDLIQSLCKNEELLDFVLDYPEKKDEEENIEITEDVEVGNYPKFYQWDERWGYLEYGDNMIAINGCGPTCLSMVVMGLTGNKEQTPKAIADFSNENGYYFESGTGWELMKEGAKDLGLQTEEVGGDANSILAQLEMGRVLIVSVGPGDFTSQGHYIVIESSNYDKTVNIHDPNSKIRTEQAWDPAKIASQAKNIWAYWVE